MDEWSSAGSSEPSGPSAIRAWLRPWPDIGAPPPPAGDRFAEELRGFGVPGIVAFLAIILAGNVFIGNIALPLGAVLVLVWVRLSRTPWSAIGYARPTRWIPTIAAGIALGIALKFVMKALVMPLLGADPVNQAYHHLAGNRALLPAAVWAMFVAGFGEETVFRGYMFERFGRLFGESRGTNIAAVIITAVWFGLAHYATQGLSGAQQGLIFGLLFGAIYVKTRSVWMLMIAHTAFDLTALAMIYWNVEAQVAHLIFK